MVVQAESLRGEYHIYQTKARTPSLLLNIPAAGITATPSRPFPYALPGFYPKQSTAEQSSSVAWWTVNSILQGGVDLQDEWRLLFFFSFFST